MRARLVQVSLLGEILPEKRFHVLGFVSITVLGLSKDVWFSRLDSEQVSSVGVRRKAKRHYCRVQGFVQSVQKRCIICWFCHYVFWC